MADLNDLNISSIMSMDNDEAIETLRQIRLSRRVPVKTTRTIKPKKQPLNLDSNAAEAILKILKGES